MREGEPEYWDKVAQKVVKDGAINDNWRKRRVLGQFLLKAHWEDQRVLEIGVGCGVTASLLGFACGKQWDYIGTDVSPKFIEVARSYKLNVIQADVLSLPPGPFTRILALDSLEHVHPFDRDEGYKNIAERLDKGGLLFINMPTGHSGHQDEFDHGIDLTDIVKLESNGLTLIRYEHYGVTYKDGSMSIYNFVVMTK